MYLKTLLISGTMLLGTLCARAGNEPVAPAENTSRNEVTGSVFHADNRRPLRDVTITAYSAAKKEMSVTTDANGNYYFDGLRSGTYRFVFERAGYRKVTREKIGIRTDEGFQLNIGMDEEEGEFNWLPGTLQLVGAE